MRLTCLSAVALLSLLAVACSDKKQGDVVKADETTEEALPERFENDLPMAADELFDDFMYYFASNEDLQRRRIDFPLKVQGGKDGKATTIEESQWQVDPFFMEGDEYTIIYDKPEQWELVNDTTLSNVTVEKILLSRDTVMQYLFERTDGRWHMTGIRSQRLDDNANAQFLKFYQKFASDSLFQQNSLKEEIEFSGPDPDDDFAQMDGFISPTSWDAFAPDIPRDSLYNIVYSSQDGKSKVKYFKICGISNGLQTELVFEQAKGKWMLTKLTE